MFDTIILLTGLVEQQALSSLLLEFNPALNIIPILTSAELSDVAVETLEHARLIAFATSVIVPREVLDRLRFGAYNFHPGPPEYPGWAPAHFALYDRACRFGVTVHEMVERVDEGRIVEADWFEIPKGTTPISLEGMAYARLARMFWALAGQLATSPEALATKPIAWSKRKNTRRGYADVCDIPLDISKEELDRRLAVFGDNHFGMSPTIRLHGVEFRALQRRD
jgi:hypothetical protein